MREGDALDVLDVLDNLEILDILGRMALGNFGFLVFGGLFVVLGEFL